ncbi:MAG: JAB domain-containing protein [Methylococcales bacterium]|nr:JAB domain-containing protein [Methylococcales bacterium]
MQFELTAGILDQRRRADDLALRQSARDGGDFDAKTIRKLSNNRGLRGNYLTTTRMAADQFRVIGSDRVDSPLEAAQAMAYLSKYPMERCEALLTDRHGRPLAIVGAFKGSLRDVPIIGHTLLSEAFRIKGAESIWVAHNHPWVLNQFSEQDERGNARMGELFRGTRLKLRGFLVYGRNFSGQEKWMFEPGPDPLENGMFSFGHHVMPVSNTVTVPVMERVYDRQEVMAGTFHMPMRFEAVDSVTGGKSGIIMANGLNMPTGFVELKRRHIGSLRKGGRMDKLYRTLSLSNAAHVYIVNYGDLSRASVYNLIGFLHNFKMKIVDLLEIEGGKMSSRRQNGFGLDHFIGFKQSAEAEPEPGLILRPTTRGPVPERAAADDKDRPPVARDEALALAGRQSGLLLLDSLRRPAAFVPLSAGAEAGSLRQALDMTAAESAMLVDRGDLSAVEIRALQQFFHGLGLPVLDLPHAGAAQPEAADGDEPATDDAGGMADGHEQIAADSRILLDWFGLESAADWFALDIEDKRRYHEQFARGFERYLFEGRAPSLSLQGVFERFRLWLLKIYRSLRGLNVELSDEARQVMGRMLASADEIRLAKQVRGMRRLFVSAREANMSPGEFAAYRRDDAGADADAAAGLMLKSLADMQWLQDARNDTLKRLQAGHAVLRRRIREQTQAVVGRMPVYRAQAFMAGLTDDLHPDVVAEMFGFGSGDELQRALAAAEPPDDLVSRWTDLKMLENHAETATDAALKRQAEAAIHNRLRGLCIATEAGVLAKSAGEMRVYGDIMEDHVYELLAGQPLGRLRPGPYLRAESRAARAAALAFRRGDIRRAAIEKRRQLLAFYAARQTYRLQDELAVGLESLDRIQESARQLDSGYRLQIECLLRRFGLGLATSQPVTLADWLKSQQARGLRPEIAGFLLDPALHMPYTRLDSRQFADLLSALRQIEHLGLSHGADRANGEADSHA